MSWYAINRGGRDKTLAVSGPFETEEKCLSSRQSSPGFLGVISDEWMPSKFSPRSSAGSEHLNPSQGVGGSNPSGDANIRFEYLLSSLGSDPERSKVLDIGDQYCLCLVRPGGAVAFLAEGASTNILYLREQVKKKFGEAAYEEFERAGYMVACFKISDK